ncbi:hypothetical protein WAJ30_21750, partial [Acinetobacter baumannii]
APDADLYSVGEFYHNWVTEAVTDLVFRKLEEGAHVTLQWDALLAGRTHGLQAAIPESVREIGVGVAATVGSIVSEAASVVNDVLD